jgi:arsenate reductase (thioredoxin)
MRSSVRLISLSIAIVFLVCEPRNVQAQGTTREQPVVTTLRFVQHYGLAKALTPEKDRKLKTDLLSQLLKYGGLPKELNADLFDAATFQKIAGEKRGFTLEAMEEWNLKSLPETRKAMNEKLRQHVELLTTQFDMIGEQHQKATAEFADWIAANYEAGKPLAAMTVCTGNTRRSMLGSTMGNVAAAYYGFRDLKFYSGGTYPIAFNPRTIFALTSIGVEIEATGEQAPRGEAGEQNPIYRVRWGKGLEITEFSKLYSDAFNPQKDFAALMVCSDADDSCPKVKGATLRLSVPYLDPKTFDGASFEAAKYAERRDDIGRFMLNALMQARRKLDAAGKLK